VATVVVVDSVSVSWLDCADRDCKEGPFLRSLKDFELFLELLASGLKGCGD